MQNREGNQSASKIFKEMKLISDFLPAVVVSLLLALFSLLSVKLTFNGDVSGSFYENRISDFGFLDLVIFFVFAAIFVLVFALIRANREFVSKVLVKREQGRFSVRVVWVASAVIMMASWLVYILAYCPGSVLGDSLVSVNQALKDSYTNHHPVFYSLIVGVFVKVGLAFGNINYGVLAYSLFQSAILAATLGYVIKFMYEMNARIGWLIAALAFFCVAPFFPTYAIIMWKDPLFSCSLALLSFVLIRFARDDGALGSRATLVLLGIACLLVMFLRNNGVVIVPIVAVCVLIAYRKRAKFAFAVMGAAIVTAAMIQGPVYHALGISTPSVEAFGIPLQQIAYVITEDPDSLTEEQKEIANNILPYDRWAECYIPGLVDTIKWSKDFDSEYLANHKSQVMGLWLQLLVEHPASCLKAYALSTLGFWHPYYQNSYGYIDSYISGNSNGIGYSNVLGDEATVSLRNALGAFRPQIGTGVFVWLMLACFALAWRPGRRGEALFFLPGLLCWLTILIATPVAFSLRYVYVLVLLAPAYLILPFAPEARRAGKAMSKGDPGVV